MAEGHDPYAALRHANFRRLLAGTILAAISREMQRVAVGWELYQRTGSAAALGYVGLVQVLPVIVLALPAGQAADRYNRKLLLMGGQVLVACASLGIAALSYFNGPVPLFYVFLLLAGVAQAFNMPTRWALLAQVVPSPTLANAVTWNSSGIQLSLAIGPALGGLVIAGVDASAANLLSAVGALLAAGLVFGIRPQSSERSREPPSLASLLAGVAFVRRTKLILATITLDLFAVLFGGATALLPIFAKDILEVGPAGLGWLSAAPPLGAVLMALILAHGPPLRRAGPALLWAVSGFGVATIVFGLSENFWLSFAMLALTGALDNISVVVRGTLVQVLTPDAMRGRVSAVNAIFISSSNQLGAFESGITADWFGPVWSVVGGGLATLAVVVVAMLTWPEVIGLGALHDVKPAQLPEPASEQGKAASEPA
jgi:MFS family permease